MRTRRGITANPSASIRVDTAADFVTDSVADSVTDSTCNLVRGSAASATGGGARCPKGKPKSEPIQYATMATDTTVSTSCRQPSISCRRVFSFVVDGAAVLALRSASCADLSSAASLLLLVLLLRLFFVEGDDVLTW
jgi:hypothetical protein